MPVLAGVALVAAIAWVYLLAGHGGFWRTDQRLPAVDPRWQPERWPSVVAVVPARNEAAVLPLTLPSLLAQEYPGEFAVLLVDDGSTDGTAEVAGTLGRGSLGGGWLDGGLDGGSLGGGAGAAGGVGVRVVPAGSPPAGWAGKVHAMAAGLGAAGECDYVLFTDADIGYAPGTLTALVRAAVAGDRALVSQMALLRADTGWERLIVPAFVYFFAQLYPFRWVNRPGSRTAAAAGGCMLVHRATLAAAGGLAPISGARIDDVALGRLLKRPPSQARCWLGFTTEARSRRPYPRLAGLWDMIARSAYVQLRYSPVLLGLTLLGLLWLYAVPPVAVLAGLAGLAAWGVGAGAGPAAAWSAWCAVAGLAGWLLMSASFLPVLRLYRLGGWRAPALPGIALLYAVMTADSARRHYAGRGGEWKGRTLPAGRQAQ